VQLAVGQSSARVLDAQDEGHRRALTCRDLEALDRLERARRRRQRRAQARSPVAVAQTPHLELRGGREFGQAQAAPHELVLVERHFEPAERQLVYARSQLDPRAARRREGLGERQVVKLDRPAVTRVERARRLTCVIGEQVGKRVQRRSQIVRAAAAFRGVLEGELGIGEHRARPGHPGADGLVQRRQGGRGIVLRNVGNPADPKHVLGEVAEFAGREHVAGQLAMDALRVGPADPDRRCAAGGHEQSQEAAERRERLGRAARSALARDGPVDAHGRRRLAKSASSSSAIRGAPTATRRDRAGAAGRRSEGRRQRSRSNPARRWSGRSSAAPVTSWPARR
jgi:hypothetical protein